MNIAIFFPPFLVSFLTSVGLISFLIWLRNRKIRSGNFQQDSWIRLGGLAIIVSFILSLLINKQLVFSQPLWGVILASVLILLFGLWDDFRNLDWKTQLFFQVAVVVLVFIFGVRTEYITNPLGGFLFLNVGKYLLPSLFFGLFWTILLMNAVNWLDGIDGLSGGLTLIAALAIFFLSLRPEVNQPQVGIITMALVGAILGFLLFNFYPARIQAGTSGALFMGFIMAVLSIYAGAKIATTLLILAVPIIDFFWVIGERLKSGQSIFESDKRHLHFKLREIGWSPLKIVLFFYCVIFIIAVLTLNTRAMGKVNVLVVVTVAMVAFLFYISRKIAQNQKSKLDFKKDPRFSSRKPGGK